MERDGRRDWGTFSLGEKVAARERGRMRASLTREDLRAQGSYR